MTDSLDPLNDSDVQGEPTFPLHLIPDVVAHDHLFPLLDVETRVSLRRVSRSVAGLYERNETAKCHERNLLHIRVTDHVNWEISFSAGEVLVCGCAVCQEPGGWCRRARCLRHDVACECALLVPPPVSRVLPRLAAVHTHHVNAAYTCEFPYIVRFLATLPHLREFQLSLYNDNLCDDCPILPHPLDVYIYIDPITLLFVARSCPNVRTVHLRLIGVRTEVDEQTARLLRGRFPRIRRLLAAYYHPIAQLCAKLDTAVEIDDFGAYPQAMSQLEELDNLGVVTLTDMHVTDARVAATYAKYISDVSRCSCDRIDLELKNCNTDALHSLVSRIKDIGKLGMVTASICDLSPSAVDEHVKWIREVQPHCREVVLKQCGERKEQEHRLFRALIEATAATHGGDKGYSIE